MKLTSRNSRPGHCQRGSQIVELALVTPLLLLIVMIIFEGLFFIRAHQVINNAAREGARIASQTEGKDFIDSGTSNVLGIAASCTYLNNNKAVFPGWGGDDACGSPFTIVVQPVNPTDPDAIYVDGVNMPSTRAIVTYAYSLKYMPKLAFFGWQAGTINLQAKAQFRNFY